MATFREVYDAAKAADSELDYHAHRVYGREACNARYWTELHRDPELIDAVKTYQAACAVLRDYMTATIAAQRAAYEELR